MQKINLRELYPDIYKTDTYLEISDEVQAVFLADKRAEARYLRQMYNYKAHYSLTTDQEDYMVAFQYRMLDADNPDQVGLVSFEIVTKEAFDREDFLWTYEDNPGVYATE